MLGFQRHEGIKTTLGLGEYDPLFKELKDGLDRYFHGKDLWSSEKIDLAYTITWVHKIDRGGGNCHSIIGFPNKKASDKPMKKEVVLMARKHLSFVFIHNNCKMISIDSYAEAKQKILKKYGLTPEDSKGNGMIIIKYSKKS